MQYAFQIIFYSDIKISRIPDISKFPAKPLIQGINSNKALQQLIKSFFMKVVLMFKEFIQCMI